MELDYTSKYKKNDIVFLSRYIERVGIQEVCKLKLRTVMSEYMVGIIDKSNVLLIGKDMSDKIFLSQKDAKKHLDSIAKKPRKFINNDIPTQLFEDEEEEIDDIDSYINGDVDE